MAYENTPMYTADDVIRISKDRDGFMQWFLNCKEDINDLISLWRGYERNNKNQWVHTKDSEERRMMNEKGIHWARQLLESYLGRVFQTTDWNEEHMNFEMRSAARSVWYGLATYWKEFGMEKMNADVIGREIFTQIHAMLLSARGSGIKDFLTKTHQVSEIRQDNANDNRGFFSGVGSMFKKNNQEY